MTHILRAFTFTLNWSRKQIACLTSHLMVLWGALRKRPKDINVDHYSILNILCRYVATLERRIKSMERELRLKGVEAKVNENRYYESTSTYHLGQTSMLMRFVLAILWTKSMTKEVTGASRGDLQVLRSIVPFHPAKLALEEIFLVESQLIWQLMESTSNVTLRFLILFRFRIHVQISVKTSRHSHPMQELESWLTRSISIPKLVIA